MDDSHDAKGLWQEHLGLIATGVALSSTAFRMLAMADWDPLTAAAIVQKSGSVNLTIASAVALVPLGIASACGIATAEIINRIHRGHKVGLYFWGFWFFLLVFTSVLITVLGAALLSAWVLTVAVRKRWGKPGRAASNTAAERENRTEGMVFLGCLVLLAFSSSPIFASEVITIKGERPTFGYILDENETSVTAVLDSAEGRQVRVIPQDQVAHEICQRSDPLLLRRLGLIVNTESPYPVCPD